MKPERAREDQWMAYHLEELSEEDRARVESELKASPELAESYRRFADALRLWATEEIAARPFDIEAFRASQETRRLPQERTPLKSVTPGLRFLPGRLAWALAAAALVLFALSQTHFTLTLGNATLHWGTPKRGDAETALRAQLDESQDQLALLQGGMEQNMEILQAIAQRQIDTEKHFIEVTDRLGYYQQVEAATRYRDTNALMNELAAYQPRRSP